MGLGQSWWYPATIMISWKSPWYPAIPINLSWYSPSYFLREDYVHMVLSKNSVPQNPSVNHHLPYHLTAINLGILPAQFSGTTPKSYSRIYIYIYPTISAQNSLAYSHQYTHHTSVDIQNYPSHQVINHHDLSHDLSHYSYIDYESIILPSYSHCIPISACGCPWLWHDLETESEAMAQWPNDEKHDDDDDDHHHHHHKQQLS